MSQLPPELRLASSKSTSRRSWRTRVLLAPFALLAGGCSRVPEPSPSAEVAAGVRAPRAQTPAAPRIPTPDEGRRRARSLRVAVQRCQNGVFARKSRAEAVPLPRLCRRVLSARVDDWCHEILHRTTDQFVFPDAPDFNECSVSVSQLASRDLRRLPIDLTDPELGIRSDDSHSLSSVVSKLDSSTMSHWITK